MKHKSKIYHGQATIDKYAKMDDLEQAIISTTLKQIQEAYQESLMCDLLLEAQEAY